MPANGNYSFGNLEATYEFKLDPERHPEHVVLLRRVSIENLAAAGILDSMDLLTQKVSTEVISPAQSGRRPQDHKGKKPTKAQEEEAERLRSAGKIFGMFDSVQDIVSVMGMINQAIVRIVAEPAVTMPPDDDAEREDGTVYADMIPLPYRMKIFHNVMGSVDNMDDLASFRDDTEENVGDMEDERAVSPKTKRDSRARK